MNIGRVQIISPFEVRNLIFAMKKGSVLANCNLLYHNFPERQLSGVAVPCPGKTRQTSGGEIEDRGPLLAHGMREPPNRSRRLSLCNASQVDHCEFPVMENLSALPAACCPF